MKEKSTQVSVSALKDVQARIEGIYCDYGRGRLALKDVESLGAKVEDLIYNSGRG